MSTKKDKSWAWGQIVDKSGIVPDVSRTAELYGRLFALQETQIHLLEEIKKVKEEIEKVQK